MLHRFRSVIVLGMVVCLSGVAIQSAAAERVRVPGTRVSLLAPEDFIPATEFPGFMLPERGVSIVVYEIPQPMRSYKENFSPEAIEKQGLSFIESSRLTVDSYDALMVRAVDSGDDLAYEVLMLVVGEIRRSIMLLASYPERDAFDFRTRMSEALLSVEWDLLMEVPEQEGLGFEIEESSRLQIFSRYPEMIILTEGGRQRSNLEAPILLVRRTTGAFDFGNLEAYSREQIRQSEVVEDLTGMKGMLRSVDQMPGYEITARGVEPKSGTAMAIYQLVLGEAGQIFIVQGFVGDTHARTFVDEFRDVGESLRRIR